ncbi:hypothetical protein HanIR_Chr09g0438301 [Helianthus annuus]|nr:hypothetical protein HanIR_Chr09g0438301 [Helianthus annuus]
MVNRRFHHGMLSQIHFDLRTHLLLRTTLTFLALSPCWISCTWDSLDC